jgi:transposase InsO family protein
MGFRLFWTWKSRPRPGRPPLAETTITLIKEMAAANPLRGTERIRGELLKLNIHVAKRTIQKYLPKASRPRPRGQTWSTFLRTQAKGIWACDFIHCTDLCCRSIFAFFMVEQVTRRVVHLGATRHPTDAWVAQQLREATPYGQKPKFLIRDNDAKFGPAFTRLAQASGIKIIRTPVWAPRANAIVERFLGRVRRECLDHALILGERHLHQVLRHYTTYFNQARPHQGLHQAIPEPPVVPAGAHARGSIRAVPVLRGLHHDYQRAA